MNFIGDSSNSEPGTEISVAEWAKSKKPVLCPFAKKEVESYGYNVTKDDRIFDMLLDEGQLKLPFIHVIPLISELKGRKYYKWHHLVTHNTNDCKTFRKEIQTAIEQGRIKFDSTDKPMKIDGHPFLANAIDIGTLEAGGKAKEPVSDRAEENGAVGSEN